MLGIGFEPKSAQADPTLPKGVSIAGWITLTKKRVGDSRKDDTYKCWCRIGWLRCVLCYKLCAIGACFPFGLLVVLLLLTTCNSSDKPAPPATTTVPDMLAYLVQARCPDGSLPTQCSVPVNQLATDTVFWRRLARDQKSDSVLAQNMTVVQTFAYPPYGRFVAANGDGGQVLATTTDSAIILKTQDGGKPGVQYFVGPNCGGTGWVVFRNDAPTGSWASLVATLSDQPDPSACPALASSFTRYRLETVPIPFTLVDGTTVTLPTQTIISEHYNAASMDKASALERSYFGLHWGLLRWEAWSTQPGLLPPPGVPEIGPIAAAPEPGPCPTDRPVTQRCWVMVDSRQWSTITPEPGTWHVGNFGWP